MTTQELEQQNFSATRKGKQVPLNQDKKNQSYHSSIPLRRENNAPWSLNPPLPESQRPRPSAHRPTPSSLETLQVGDNERHGICTIPRVCGCSGSKARLDATSEPGRTRNRQPQLEGGSGTHCGQPRTGWGCSAGAHSLGAPRSPRSRCRSGAGPTLCALVPAPASRYLSQAWRAWSATWHSPHATFCSIFD